MSARRLKIGATAAGLLCLLAGYVVAQQLSEQVDRPATTDRDRSATRQLDRDPSGRATTQFGQRDVQGRTGTHSQEVEYYLAKCLLLKNQGEIELAQLAQQQSQNPQVKQFAQKMVQDHTKLVQQLQQLAGARGEYGRTTESTTPDATPGAVRQSDAQRNAGDTTRLPGSPGATQPGNQIANQGLAGTTPGAPQGTMQSSALHHLAQIEQQIAEHCKQAFRDELQQKQGIEFDKAFVGSQIGGHMHMLSALAVIGQQTQGQLAQVAQQAQPTVQQHLDHAKQLMQQLEQQGAGRPGAQAERPSRTQRE
jgi:predicted outer membrane protein